MKYIAMVFILLVSVHTFSFAKYNWDKKNRTAAVGAILISLISIILPALIMFFH